MQAVADTGKAVRQAVKRVLEASPAYKALAAEAQREIADAMVRVGVYLAEPEGMKANSLPGAIAGVPADVAAHRDLLSSVNFPAFVSALINGVFQAIVDASIQQMQAYGDLLKDVARTVDEFAGSPITVAAASAWLAKLYPDCLQRDAASGVLRPKKGGDCSKTLPQLRLLPLEGPLGKLGQAQIENQVVPAARRKLAVSRQQLLATMVMMGINRIVVTDGK